MSVPHQSADLQKRLNEQINQTLLQEIQLRELSMKNQYLEKELDRMAHQTADLKKSHKEHKAQYEALRLEFKNLQTVLESKSKKEHELLSEIDRLHKQLLGDKSSLQNQISSMSQDNQKLIHTLEEASRVKDQIITNLHKDVFHSITLLNGRLHEIKQNHQCELQDLTQKAEKQGNSDTLLNELKIKLQIQQEQLHEMDQLKMKNYEQDLIIKRLKQNEAFLKSEIDVSFNQVEKQRSQLQKSFEEQSNQLFLAKDEYQRKSQYVVQEMLNKEKQIDKLQKKTRYYQQTLSNSLKRDESKKRKNSNSKQSETIDNIKHFNSMDEFGFGSQNQLVTKKTNEKLFSLSQNNSLIMEGNLRRKDASVLQQKSQNIQNIKNSKYGKRSSVDIQNVTVTLHNSIEKHQNTENQNPKGKAKVAAKSGFNMAKNNQSLFESIMSQRKAKKH